MDWYLLVKFLHVAFAIIWLGGALIMVILGAAAERAANDAQLVGVVRQVAWSAERIFVPASVLTLVFGVIATWINGYWSQLWVILGLVGIAATIAIGVAVLTPRAKKVESGFAQSGASKPVVAVSREILTIAKFDMTMLFVVVAIMVLKPDASDWPTLVVLAAVLVAAGAAFLLPLRRAGMASA